MIATAFICFLFLSLNFPLRSLNLFSKFFIFFLMSYIFFSLTFSMIALCLELFFYLIFQTSSFSHSTDLPQGFLPCRLFKCESYVISGKRSSLILWFNLPLALTARVCLYKTSLFPRRSFPQRSSASCGHSVYTSFFWLLSPIWC